MIDEYGGVAVEDAADEFGGIPIDQPTEEEILSRPAEPAWPMPFGARGSNPNATFDPYRSAIASRELPLPGYTSDLAQELQRSAAVRKTGAEPSELALKAGRFQNEQALGPPQAEEPGLIMDLLEGAPFGSQANLAKELLRSKQGREALDLYRQTLHGSIKDVGAGMVEQARQAERMGQIAGSQVAAPGSELPLPPTEDSETIKAIRGIVDSIGGQVEGVLQPEMLPLLFTGALPGAIGKTATALFMADIYRHTPQIFNEVQDALQSGDVEKEAKALTDAIGAGTFLGLMGAHLKAKPTIREGVDDFISKYTPEQRAAFYRRLRPEFTEQLKEKPIPIPESEVSNASGKPETTATETVQHVALTDLLGNGVDVNLAKEYNRPWSPEVQKLQAEAEAAEATAKGKPEDDPLRKIAYQKRSVADKAAGRETSAGEYANTVRRERRKYENDNEDKLGTPEYEQAMREYDKIIKQHEDTADEVVFHKNRRTNARAQQKTAAVHGDLQSQPIKGEEKVPAPESSGGILTQAERGVREPSGGTPRNEPSATEGELSLNERVAKMTPSEFTEWTKTLPEGGVTRAAFDLAKTVTSEDVVNQLKERADALGKKVEEIRAKVKAEPDIAKKLPLLEEGGVMAVQQQFFNEAHDYAIADPNTSGGQRAIKEGHTPKVGPYTPEAVKLSQTLPISEFKGEVPETHIPVKVERPDGSTYEAWLVAAPGSKMAGTRIAKVKAEAGGLTDGVLGKGDKIIEGPKTPEEYAKAKEEKIQQLRQVPSGTGVSNVPQGGEGQQTQPSATLIDQPAAGALGITPGAATAKQFGKLAVRAFKKLNNTRRAFGTLWRGRDVGKHMDQTMDAADNQAMIAAQQVRKGLEVATTKRDQNAAAAIIEAGFDQSKLNDFLRKAQAGGNKEAELAVRDAMRDWTRLQDLAQRGKADLDAQLADENANGINTEAHEDYVPHVYDQDLWMGAGRPFVIGGGGTGIGTGFKKGRTFPTIYDAIEAGYKPKSLALSELAEHRVHAGQRLINRKQWAEGLKNVNDPTDGRPVAADLIRKQRGPGGTWYEVAPQGYRAMEIIPGVRTAIHDVYVPLFKALTGESAISSSVPGKLALEVTGNLKHGLLAFDTFHASRILQKQLVLTGKAGYKKGQSLLEYADKDLQRAEAAGEITPEIASWIRQNRPIADLGIKNGLNVGRVAEAMYNSFIRDVPGIGTFNKWVFEKLTRGAMMESFIHEFNRVSRARPELTPDQVAKRVARDLNTYFGNLGRQGFFKSKTMQDTARLISLAPQWFEAMARTEAKGYTQLAKGLTYDPIVHKTLAVGTLGKAMGTGLVAYFVANQLLNLATRGKPTWQNEEEGHKMDAWVPNWDGKGNGYFLSTLAIPAELSHDMLRYSRKDGSSLKAAAHILSNKASPAVRAGAALFTGKAFYGDESTSDSWERVKKAAWSFNPTPIPLQPLERKSYPGQLQRQLTASLGIKTEPAESPVQQMFTKANKFMAEEGKPRPETERTDAPSYSKLRSALRNDNKKEATKMLEQLQKTHSDKQIMNAMKHNVLHPFTGSRKQEMRFRQSLTDKEADLYDKAVEDRANEYTKFLDFWMK